jgi:hypothetical protein
VRRQVVQLLVVVVGLVAAVSATAAPRSGGRTLSFLDVTQRFIPLEGISQNAPPSIGARYIFIDALYNRAPQFGKPTGARVGRVEGVCTVVSEQATMCNIVGHVPDGFVTVAGSNVGNKVQWFAVTGGVGAYANARGTVKVTSVSDNKSIVVVRLTS